MKNRVITVQQEGRHAEIVVDTGHPLRNGKTWQAYAKVFCPNVFTARLVAEQLGRQIGDAVEKARREAYEDGYEHALKSEPRLTAFSREL